MAHKIILDTDPGIDDAMAIFTAIAHPDIDLLGLTTTFGNVSVEQATHNALALLAMGQSKAVVAKGVSQPEQHEPLPFPDFVHGDNGLGNIEPPSASTTAITQTAAEYIVEQVQANPQQVTLVAVGPLGNLAAALALAPNIAQQVKQVVLMGGVMQPDGNVSPVAEANIFADPVAADKVMAAHWPVVMVGLDVTQQVSLSRNLFADIAQNNPKVGTFMQDASNFYIDFYMSVRKEQIQQQQGYNKGDEACYAHDVSALAYVINPALFTTVEGAICVATEGVARGQTIVNHKGLTSYFLTDWNKRPKHKTCIAVDAQGVTDLFYNALTNSYWQQ